MRNGKWVGKLAISALVLAVSAAYADDKKHDDVDIKYQAGGSTLSGEEMHQNVDPKAPPMTAKEFQQIGRASSRERVCTYVEISVVAVSVKKKQKKQQDE